jgi:elongin-A
VYNSTRPPLARQYRPQMVAASSSTPSLPSTSSVFPGGANPGSTSRVTVRTVTVRRPPTSTPQAAQISSHHTPSTDTTQPANPSSVSSNTRAVTPTELPDPHSEEVQPSISPPPTSATVPRPVLKKKPTNSLFMPKGRAYSQLSTSR